MLATTDDPCDDLSAHAALAADDTWSGRVIPTFRPDRYLEPAQPGWPELVGRLGEAADVDTGSYAGWVAAMESAPPATSSTHGATSADHSHEDVRTDPLDAGEAERDLPPRHWRGSATVAEAVALRRHMLLEMARMSCDDGLVMTLHPAVRRDHHRPTAERFGAGHRRTTSRCAVEFTDALRPLLERFGTHPNLHLVLFTLDETVFSRELGAAGRLLSLGVRRCALVVPRRPRRGPPVPASGHRDRRLLPYLRLHRRHPRLLLHPRPARHVPPPGQRLPRPARRRAPDRRGRGARHGRRPGQPADPGGFQAVTAALAPCPAAPATAARPLRCALVHLGLGNFFRAHQAWYTDRAPDAAEWGIAAFTGRERTARRGDCPRRTASTP